MKKVIIIFAIALTSSCNSNREKEILNQKDLILKEIYNNSKEKDKIKLRLKFIKIEISALKNNLTDSKNKKQKVKGLISEIKYLIIQNKKIRESDSLNFIKIDMLDNDLQSLK